MGRGALVSLAAIALALVAGLSALGADLRAAARPDHADERLYLPDGRFLRLASLGFPAPAADYTWLQAVQYYGGYRRGEHDLRYFDGLVEAVTTLDPEFEDAYVFSALVHCLDANDQRGAVDVLKRGLVALPDSWRLHFEIGFIHYVFTGEFGVASRWFALAAEQPGASDFCRRFAAWSAGRDGDLLGSLYLWENLRRTTENPDMRDLAGRMVDSLRARLSDEPGSDPTSTPKGANP
ncbi:MAG: hypothetical protein R3D98_12370 [Candidatus Krumholzibacteriia bacterium]